MYVLLFLVFIASLVTQKLSLAIASTKLPTERQKDEKKITNSLEPFNVNKKEKKLHKVIHISKDMNNTCVFYKCFYTFPLEIFYMMKF